MWTLLTTEASFRAQYNALEAANCSARSGRRRCAVGLPCRKKAGSKPSLRNYRNALSSRVVRCQENRDQRCDDCHIRLSTLRPATGWVCDITAPGCVYPVSCSPAAPQCATSRRRICHHWHGWWIPHRSILRPPNTVTGRPKTSSCRLKARRPGSHWTSWCCPAAR